VDFASASESKTSYLQQHWQPPIIKHKQYEDYIVFSDIHADLASFFISMIQSDILVLYDPATDSYLNKAEIVKNCLENHPRLDIFGVYLQTYQCQLSHNCAGKAIMVLGDLIDGRRNIFTETDFIDVYNVWGLNELGIHLILHNLRVSAQTMKANVYVLYGNHEMCTIVNTDARNLIPFYYINGVDEITKMAFTKIERAELLHPFYLVDNALFAIIVDDVGIKYLLSHGSFSIDTKADDQDFSRSFTDVTVQNLINLSKILSDNIFSSFDNPANMMAYNIAPEVASDQSVDIPKMNPGSVMWNLTWSRSPYNLFVYTTSDDGGRKPSKDSATCKSLNSILGNKYTTYIMGHCITSTFLPMREDIPKGCRGTKHSGNQRECIYAGCVNQFFRPKIIFVDNALAMHNSGYGRDRDHIVQLEQRVVSHNNTMTNVYYTTISPFFGEMLLITSSDTMIKDKTVKAMDMYLIVRSLFNNENKTGQSIFYQLDMTDQLTIPKRFIFAEGF
jgi:hypothetical protein